MNTSFDIQTTKNDGLLFTNHARNQMSARGFSPKAIKAAMQFGRITYIRGAMIYVIGKREVDHFQRKGIALYEYAGIHVVCSTTDNVIITVYRNHNFRNLRPKRGSVYLN